MLLVLEDNDYFGEFETLDDVYKEITHHSNMGDRHRNYRVFKCKEYKVEPCEPEIIQSYSITQTWHD